MTVETKLEVRFRLPCRVLSLIDGGTNSQGFLVECLASTVSEYLNKNSVQLLLPLLPLQIQNSGKLCF